MVSRTTIKTFPIKRRLNEKIILLAEPTGNIQPGSGIESGGVIIAALLFHPIVFPFPSQGKGRYPVLVENPLLLFPRGKRNDVASGVGGGDTRETWRNRMTRNISGL